MRKQTANAPLIIEPYPETYQGYPFLTMLRYNDENYINIVDNVLNKAVQAYVLDLCSPESIKEDLIIEVAHSWFTSQRHLQYPLSIEFSRRGMDTYANGILRTFPIDFISRVIGPLPEYPMGGILKTRKRKRKPIPNNLEFLDRRSNKSF